jgi:hypothetical protein
MLPDLPKRHEPTVQRARELQAGGSLERALRQPQAERGYRVQQMLGRSPLAAADLGGGVAQAEFVHMGSRPLKQRIQAVRDPGWNFPQI